MTLYEKMQEAWLKETNIKIGDTVTVNDSFTEKLLFGSGLYINPEMYEYVGKQGRVVSIGYNAIAVVFSCDITWHITWHFPFYSLDPVSAHKRKSVILEGNRSITGCPDVCVDEKWAFSIMATEEDDAQSKAQSTSNQYIKEGALLYLADCNGKWVDEKNQPVSGYLYFKPNE